MTIANKLVHRILIRIQEYSMEEENLFYVYSNLILSRK